MTRPTLLIVLCLLAAAPAATAQNYPYPGKETPVLCTGCGGTNEGLPTYPYDDPLVAHAGRYVDSSTTGNVQNAGMRTVRARVTRVAPERNRIYVAMGEAIGAYTLDQFFTTNLRQPMVPVNTIEVNTATAWTRYGEPYEKLTRPESLFYAEALDSGWTTYLQDGQRVLTDFDADDRGYVYIGTTMFGWGIAEDERATDGRHMRFVFQEPNPSVYPSIVFVLKSGTSYHAVVASSSRTDGAILLYDVTAPAAPKVRPARSGGILSWAKFDAGQRLALIQTDGRLRVYDYATFVAAGAPVAEYAPPTGRKFTAAAFDEQGALWVALSGTSGVTTNVLMKMTPGASGYSTTSFDLYDGAFNAAGLAVAAGRLAVIGSTSASRELRLFDVGGATPVRVDTGNFFRNYYEVVPSGYADPGSMTGANHVRVIEQGAQTYLMFSAEGLGDAFRLDRGTTPRVATSIALTATDTTLTATVSRQEAAAEAPAGVVTLTRDGVARATAKLVADGGAFKATFARDAGATASAYAASFEGDDVHLPSGPARVGDAQTALAAPSGVTATASGTSGVVITWQPVFGATAYRVFRASSISGAFAAIGDVTGTLHTDVSVAANTTYLYRVVALDATRASAASATDIATTVAFTDTPLTAGAPIRLAHLTELRVAANALRAAAGLAPAAFADATIGSLVRGSDITALRAACDEARALLALGAVAESPITAGVTTIRRDDFVNLRLAVE